MKATDPHPVDPTIPTPCRTRGRVADLFALLVIGLTGLVLGLAWVDRTGPLWYDSPRYTNAAAMIHDWILSPDHLHPLEYARSNYSQYPAFSVPYHPPGYPLLLGSVFAVTGVSYTVARVFVAVCLGVAGCVFYGLLRRLDVVRWAALLGALLLLTTPEIVRQGRDTMSEIPSLPFVFASAWLFLEWLRGGRWWTAWAAFAFAEVAFQCRVTSAAVLPGLFLFAVATGRTRKLLSPHVIVPAVLYVVTNAVWIRFASRYSQFEVTADGRGQGPSWQSLTYFSTTLPEMAPWGVTLLAAIGLLLAVGWLRRREAARFWICWLIGVTAFKLAMPTSTELRHFLAALPAFAGLAVCLADQDAPRFTRRLAVGLLPVGLALNLFFLSSIPAGLVGFAKPAAELAARQRPGNVLLAVWEDQELIFRYRACAPTVHRQMIRGDRTLAIRLPEYANVDPRILVSNAAGVREVLRRGRIRYVVTCDVAEGERDDRTGEMILAHDVVSSDPDRFALLGRFPLWRNIHWPGRKATVYLWQYLEDLPDGPSELPVVIPTAGVVLGSKP